MAYDPTVAGSGRNLVRHYLGGALTNDVLTDDEIDLYLTGGALAKSSTILAAVACGEYLLRQASYHVDIREGGASATLSQLAPQLRLMVAELRAVAAGAAGPTALLASINVDSAGNTRLPSFTRAMGDIRDDAPKAVDWADA